MHRIHTLTPLFQHNNGVETPLQYLLQTACTTTSFPLPTVWDHLEDILSSWKQKVSMELWNLSLARVSVALIPCCAGILEKSFMFQNLNYQRFHSVGNFGLGACCQWSLSGAFSCLFVSALQCSQQELHEMVIRFLPNTWGGKKNACSLFLAELFYTNIVTSRLLLLTAWHTLLTEPVKLGNFQVADYFFQLILISALHDCPLLMLLLFWRHIQDYILLWKLSIAVVTIVMEYFPERWYPFQAKQMFLNTSSLNGGVYL